ncbi:GbNV_gp51-like [Fopius arisanus]|nr:GbNV_gp51-like [Fopius arisanus]
MNTEFYFRKYSETITRLKGVTMEMSPVASPQETFQLALNFKEVEPETFAKLRNTTEATADESFFSKIFRKEYTYPYVAVLTVTTTIIPLVLHNSKNYLLQLLIITFFAVFIIYTLYTYMF